MGLGVEAKAPRLALGAFRDGRGAVDRSDALARAVAARAEFPWVAAKAARRTLDDPAGRGACGAELAVINERRGSEFREWAEHAV